MRTEEEIRIELDRVKESRDEAWEKKDKFRGDWMNQRYWTLRWVLGEN